MSKVEVGIFGAGGFGREVAWLAEEYAQPVGSRKVIAFVDDKKSNQGKVINGFPVRSLDWIAEKHPDSEIALAIGNPRTKEKVEERCRAKGLAFSQLVHCKTEMSKWIRADVGTIVCGGCRLTTNIQLGRHVHINLDCTIGHDVNIGDYTTIAPGVHISGFINIGKRVYIGTGAVFVNGTESSPLVVGDDSIIGAGACITKEVPPGITVAGVPARPLRY